MNTQEQIQKRLEFLQTQIDSLDNYLPETYQFLMAELDTQNRHLMELKIQDFYCTQSNELSDQNSDQRYPDQTQDSADGTT